MNTAYNYLDLEPKAGIIGFPVPYEGSVHPVRQFANAIGRAMDDAFGDSKPKLIA